MELLYSKRRTPSSRRSLGDTGPRRWRNDVVAGEAIAVVERREQRLQFLLVKAGEVEIETGGVQRVQFGRQEFLVPSAHENQLIVRDAIGADLLWRQVRQLDNRDFCEAQVAGREQPPWPAITSPSSVTSSGTVQP